ncbi:MAG TPA: hypothetical protein VET48_12345 [Steroidobacteraceae bacterium]|nr:hypothetical protein [Steroidobacteraceae bacterium]
MQKAQAEKLNVNNEVERAQVGAQVAQTITQESARLAVLSHPITQRLHKRLESFDKMIASAVQEKDLGGFAAVVNAETRSLDVQAKLAGLYAAASDGDHGAMPVTIVQVNISAPDHTAESSPGQTIDCEIDPTST